MEKRKKREKSANGSASIEPDGATLQGEFLKRQKEAEQQVVGTPPKKLAISGGLNAMAPDNPQQPYPPWNLAPPQQLQQPPNQAPQQPQLSQSPQPSSQPQTPSQPSQQGQQGGGQQVQVPGQPGQGQATKYYGGSEFAGHPAPGQYFPYSLGSTDPNWQASVYGSAQITGSNSPFAFPGGYGYPAAAGQTGYPGLWDQQSWWGANQLQQQAAYAACYGAPYPGYAYGYGTSGAPVGAPVGPFQRGLIKAPPGLSQKHQRLWEAQSAENLAMWAAFARCEAEISAHRMKILQLEAELRAVKGQHDVLQEAAAQPQPQSKRGRHKKAAGLLTPKVVPPKPRGRKPASEKMPVAGSKTDTEKTELKEMETGVKRGAQKLEGQNGVPVGRPSSVNTTHQQFGAPAGHTVRTDSTGYEGAAGSAELDGAGANYGGGFNSGFELEAAQVNGAHENGNILEDNGNVAATPPSYVHYDVKSGAGLESHSGAPDPNVSGGDEWSAVAIDDVTRSDAFDPRLLYASAGVEGQPTKPVIPNWGQYTGEDASEDQDGDDVAPSGQEDEDDAEEDEDSTVENMGGVKIENLVDLGSSKGISQLNSW